MRISQKSEIQRGDASGSSWLVQSPHEIRGGTRAKCRVDEHKLAILLLSVCLDVDLFSFQPMPNAGPAELAACIAMLYEHWQQKAHDK